MSSSALSVQQKQKLAELKKQSEVAALRQECAWLKEIIDKVREACESRTQPGQLPSDPVLGPDGYLYGSAELAKLLAKNPGKSPVTGNSMSGDAYPCRVVQDVLALVDASYAQDLTAKKEEGKAMQRAPAPSHPHQTSASDPAKAMAAVVATAAASQVTAKSRAGGGANIAAKTAALKEQAAKDAHIIKLVINMKKADADEKWAKLEPSIQTLQNLKLLNFGPAKVKELVEVFQRVGAEGEFALTHFQMNESNLDEGEHLQALCAQLVRCPLETLVFKNTRIGAQNVGNADNLPIWLAPLLLSKPSKEPGAEVFRQDARLYKGTLKVLDLSGNSLGRRIPLAKRYEVADNENLCMAPCHARYDSEPAPKASSSSEKPKICKSCYHALQSQPSPTPCVEGFGLLLLSAPALNELNFNYNQFDLFDAAHLVARFLQPGAKVGILSLRMNKNIQPDEKGLIKRVMESNKQRRQRIEGVILDLETLCAEEKAYPFKTAAHKEKSFTSPSKEIAGKFQQAKETAEPQAKAQALAAFAKEIRQREVFELESEKRVTRSQRIKEAIDAFENALAGLLDPTPNDVASYNSVCNLFGEALLRLYAQLWHYKLYMETEDGNARQFFVYDDVAEAGSAFLDSDDEDDDE